jgi:hypothetical protein
MDQNDGKRTSSRRLTETSDRLIGIKLSPSHETEYLEPSDFDTLSVEYCDLIWDDNGRCFTPRNFTKANLIVTTRLARLVLAMNAAPIIPAVGQSFAITILAANQMKA